MNTKISVNGETWWISSRFERYNQHCSESICFGKTDGQGYWFGGTWSDNHPSEPELRMAVEESWRQAKAARELSGAMFGWHTDHVQISLYPDTDVTEIHAYYGTWHPHQLVAIPERIRRVAERMWERNNQSETSEEVTA